MICSTMDKTLYLLQDKIIKSKPVKVILMISQPIKWFDLSLAYKILTMRAELRKHSKSQLSVAYDGKHNLIC